MIRVLITGMSGTGKTTLLGELAARGYKTVDTDYGDLSEVVDGEQLWREDRIQQLLSTEDAEILFVSGTTRSQVRFYPQFDHVVLLSAPTPTVAERLATRTNNPYGKDPADRARILQEEAAIEPMLRSAATLEVDTSVPVHEVVAAVLSAVRP